MGRTSLRTSWSVGTLGTRSTRSRRRPVRLPQSVDVRRNPNQSEPVATQLVMQLSATAPGATSG